MKDIILLKNAICKITIIYQSLSIQIPKYVYNMLCQIYSLDKNAACPILQNAYITNALINLQELSHTFYKMHLLLEYQNREFRCFQSDQRLSLQETNEVFKLHTLLINIFTKI